MHSLATTLSSGRTGCARPQRPCHPNPAAATGCCPSPMATEPPLPSNTWKSGHTRCEQSIASCCIRSSARRHAAAGPWPLSQQRRQRCRRPRHEQHVQRTTFAEVSGMRARSTSDSPCTLSLPMCLPLLLLRSCHTCIISSAPVTAAKVRKAQTAVDTQSIGKSFKRS
jgi:hypothetical protein